MSGKQKDLTEELTAVLEDIIEEPVVKETKKRGSSHCVE